MKKNRFLQLVLFIGSTVFSHLNSYADDPGNVPINEDPHSPPSTRPKLPGLCNISWVIENNDIVVSSNLPLLGEVVIVSLDSGSTICNVVSELHPEFRYSLNGLSGYFSRMNHTILT